MKIFIGMETSGTLRNRFSVLGHDVVSCDTLLPDDGVISGRHYVGDVFATLKVLKAFNWVPNFAVFHPTCTLHTLSAQWAFKDGPYHQKVRPETLTGADRRRERERAETELEVIKRLPFRKVVENPRGTISTRTTYGRAHEFVQPYEFGDDASKGTCFWAFDATGNPIDNFVMLRDPSNRVPGRIVDGKERWSNQTDKNQNKLTPGPERWKDRSKTFPGIADELVNAVMRIIQ